MIRLLFLLPIIMSAIWWSYLNAKGFSAKDGLKGFGYIFAFNFILLGFMITMIFITE